MKNIQTVIGIIGLGTVGTGVTTTLVADPRFKIKTIAIKDPSKARDLQIPQISLTPNLDTLVNDPEIEVIIEVAGGIPHIYEALQQAIRNGKHIITANKKLIAIYGKELFRLAREHQTTILYEAAVGGGIPLISTMQRGLLANQITRVAGILNGTTNFILTSMEEEGDSFPQALGKAQALGYAEADPTDDIEAFDLSYKIAILATLAFGQFVPFETVIRQGISAITELDIQLAYEFGYRIKALGIAELSNDQLHIKAQPMLVPLHHPLAAVEGANNAIYIRGSIVGDIMLQGPGAGQMPTASAVVGDLINLAGALRLPDFSSFFLPSISEPKQAPPPHQAAPLPTGTFYIRLETTDSPGVIGHIGLALGNHQVNLHSLIQRGGKADGLATIILLTHQTSATALQNALAEIAAQTTTQSIGLVLQTF